MRLPKNQAVGLALLIGGLIAVLFLMPGLFGAGPAPLRVLLGWAGPVLALALVLGGIALGFADPMGWETEGPAARRLWAAVLWGEVLFLALVVASHLGIADPLSAGRAGRGGGLVGWAFSQIILSLLPPPAAWAATAVVALGAAWGIVRALPPSWSAAPRAGLRQALENSRLTGSRLWAERPRLLARGRAAVLPRVPEWPSPAVALRAWLGRWRSAALKRIPWLRPPTGGAEPLGDDRYPAPGDRSVSMPADLTDREGLAPEGSRRSVPTDRTLSPARAQPPAAERTSRRKARGSTLPPLDLLQPDPNGDPGSRPSYKSAAARGQLLKQTLAEFGVPVEVVSIKEGPTVTQFGLEPGEVVRQLRNGEVVRRRVPVHHIMRLSNDLALALSAASIRIEAPVPGRPYVGVEIPNSTKSLVSLRGVLQSREFARHASPLAIALGRDVSGDPVVADLARMPHLLIAGATGSGKSVCINAIICSLLMNNGPETVRFVMVDPKMVELPGYNGIPHLLGPVISDPAQVPGALAWLMLQMDERYRLFAETGVRNIEEYHRKTARSKSAVPLPYIILVIDEMADLMMTAAYDVERQICRLAQMSRATGIHLVLATQRPSVDVITGLIKANFPARIAFAVTSQVDSRVILDAPGAERLLGRGDMLFMAPESAKLWRIQGCFVSDQEIDRIVEFWRGQQPLSSESGEAGGTADPASAPWAGMVDQMEERDDLLEKALALLENKATVSTSLLQRQLRIGFPRAARLMEQLEEMGVVGPDEGGGRSRQVLLESGTRDNE